MGCQHSSTVTPFDFGPKKFEFIFNDLDIISYFHSSKSLYFRETFIDFLRKHGLKKYFLLYEAIDKLRFSEDVNLSNDDYVQLGILLNEITMDKFISLKYPIKISDDILNLIKAIRKERYISQEDFQKLQEAKDKIYDAFGTVLKLFYISSQYKDFLDLPSHYKKDATKKHQIILATENIFFATIIGRIIRTLDFVQTVVSSCTELESALEKAHYDIIMIDSHLPGDKSVTRIFKDYLAKEKECIAKFSNYSLPKFICLLSKESEVLREDARMCGFAGTLNIPFHGDALHEVLNPPKPSFSMRASVALSQSLRNVVVRSNSSKSTYIRMKSIKPSLYDLER